MVRDIFTRRLSIDEMIEQNKAPRERLDGLVTMHRETYAALSRLIDRDEGYLQRYVSRGVPNSLRREEIALLSRYFRVPPEDLGGTPTKPAT
ncbi:hypothetical protein H5J25_13955 [Sphingomonas aliaeris]|uniref:Uncharacterized protein n=1 Tax=Sphingomonas aliaeris TaxID=2759526 RepID=A0A974NTA9_9SPHN|nr:hypothetical protein [Sphingomonas aliaeris]QQV76546.1 hypothetical protein H5J25_13955 [Sphingomonas aliaeris]